MRVQLGAMKRSVEQTIGRALGAALGSLPRGIRYDIEHTMVAIETLDYRSHAIKMYASTAIESAVRLHSCEREPSTVRWIERFRPGEVFFDVGANVGAYSLVAAVSHGGAIPVVAFEPSATTFATLCRNIALNECGCITPLQIALSDRTGVDAFHYHSLASGDALHALGRKLDYRNRPFAPAATLPVLAFRLDDLLRHFVLPEPTHLKIDVDGNELQILHGADMALRKARSVLLEINHLHPENGSIVEFLRLRGLNPVSSERVGLPESENVVFERA